MAYVSRLCLTLIICFTVGLAAIRSIGAAQANPIAILFTNPDGSPCHMPCLFGVRPGDTTIGEAIRALRVHPLTHDMVLLPVMVGGAKYGIELRAEGVRIMLSTQEAYSNDGMQVTNINLVPIAKSPGGLPEADPRLIRAMVNATPGQIVLYFGVPDNVNFANDVTATSPHDLIISYPDRGLTLLSRLKTRSGSMLDRWIAQLDMDNVLHVLDLYSPDQKEFHIGGYPWFGFTSMAIYTRKLCTIRDWPCQQCGPGLC
jgi:hypothetical protein